jgi:chromosomal replication initiator protein
MITPTPTHPPTRRTATPQGRVRRKTPHPHGVTKPDRGADSTKQDPARASRPARVYISTERLADGGDTLTINPDNGFENFVVGPGNRLAHAAAVAVAENPGYAYNPFFVHGDVGLGKTHLLQAICVSIAQANPKAVMHYVSCDTFVNDFMNSVRDGRMSDFRHRFRDVDVLVIDDIHFLAERERTQEEFFHTFNSLYQLNKQIVLSSDAPPEEIPHLEDRLISRFKWGLVARIDPPGYETRIAILQSKARLRGLDMPKEVAEFIAQQDRYQHPRTRGGDRSDSSSPRACTRAPDFGGSCARGSMGEPRTRNTRTGPRSTRSCRPSAISTTSNAPTCSASGVTSRSACPARSA